MNFQNFPGSGRPNWIFWVILAVIFLPPRVLAVVAVVAGVIFLTKKILEKRRPGFDPAEIFARAVRDATAAGRKKVAGRVRDPANSFPMPKIHAAAVAAGLAILAGVAVVADGLVSVPPGSVAVIYDRGRGVLDESLPEGLHLKVPFWQVATTIDTRLRSYTMSVAEGEGQKFGADAIEALTKDGQKVDVDITVQYRVPADKAAKIYQTIGLDFEAKVVRPGVRSVVRDAITGFESTELFSEENRTVAAQKMESALRELYEKSDLTLDKLLLRNIRFSDIYLGAIEEKQVAQQKIQKAEFERQQAEIEKETKIIQAQADAEAIRLKGESLRNAPEVIQLEFVDKMAPQINWGILPDGAVPLLDLKSLKN